MAGCPLGSLGETCGLSCVGLVAWQAIQMSVFIVRAFVRLRSIYASQIELTRRLDELDTKVSKHSEALRPIVEALRRLMLPCRSRDPERLLP